MANRNRRPRTTVEGNLTGMVCTRKQASHLLEGLRREYQLLTPEKRNQVKTFLFPGCSPIDGPHSSLKLRKLKQILDRAISEESMEDDKDYEEEISSAIRYLDPEEQERDKEIRIATIIATLALVLIVAGVWIVLWLRMRQP